MELLKGKRLLIVDDEPDLRGPLVAEFESWGCVVFEAKNGKEAFELVKKEKLDAVISDIRMPGGDGVELLRNIKELHHEFPMVMLITGFSDLSREEAYHLGAEAILSKPFDLDDLDEAVLRILTPREVRWGKSVEAAKLKKTIEHEFAALEGAIQDGGLKVGRGGLFVQVPGGFPLTGETVGLKIKFAGGDILMIEGAGIVRWVRREEAPGLPQGYGVEFESLSAETRQKVLAFTNAYKLKPYIPKA